MSIWLKTTIVLLIVCLCVISVEESRVRSAQAREAAAALEAANAIAERDSTRDVARGNARVARLVGDSIRVVEKRAVQVQQRNDALDRALGGERKAKFELIARSDSLQRLVTSPVREELGVRRASFGVRQPPYTIDADVSLPTPPDSASISLRVALDAIAIGARVQCERPDDHGVRLASMVVSAPAWASIRLNRVEQSPDVCMPQPPSISSRLGLRVRPLVGLGYVGRLGTRPALGYFVGVGVELHS